MSDSQDPNSECPEDPQSPPEPSTSQDNAAVDAKTLRRMVIKAERRARMGERLQKVMDLRIAGASPLQIAKQLAISRTSVMRLLKFGLKRSAKDYNDALAMRSLESMRMDAIRLALWQKKDDPAAAGAIIRASERQAALFGIDAPEAMRILPPESPPTDIDVNRLTADEAIYLRNIVIRQQAERNAIDVQPERPALVSHETDGREGCEASTG